MSSHVYICDMEGHSYRFHHQFKLSTYMFVFCFVFVFHSKKFSAKAERHMYGGQMQLTASGS